MKIKKNIDKFDICYYIVMLISIATFILITLCFVWVLYNETVFNEECQKIGYVGWHEKSGISNNYMKCYNDEKGDIIVSDWLYIDFSYKYVPIIYENMR